MSALDFLQTEMQVGQPAAYKPASFGEVVQSAMYAFGQRTGFEAAPIIETAQDYSQREKLLSERFAPDELTKLIGTDQELRDEALRQDYAEGKTSYQGYMPDINAVKNKRLDSAISQGREQDPAKWQGIKTSEELQEEKRNRARAATESYQDIASRASPTSALAGSLVGGIGAAFTDPINIATLPLGATSGMGILKAMKTEALLNAAVEAAEIPLVSAWQKELGYKYGVGDAALDVATAGAGGAVLTGIIKGVGPAFDAIGRFIGSKSQPILQKIAASEKLPSSVREAASYMSRVAHIDENNPIKLNVDESVLDKPNSVSDIALHRQTLQDTQDAFKNYDQPVFNERLNNIPTRTKLYHGTSEIFDNFDKNFLGSNTKAQSAKLGFFFTDNPEVAKVYAERGQTFKNLTKSEYNEMISLIGTKSNIEQNGEKAVSPSILEQYKTKDKARLEELQTKLNSSPATVKEVYLDYKNPKIVDLKGAQRTKGDFVNLIKQAKAENFDALIIKNTRDTPSLVAKMNDQLDNIHIVFDEKQIKKINPQTEQKSVGINSADSDLIFRPNDALASMQRDIETMQSLNTGDTFKADFERLLKDNPDLEIETEAGRLTLKEVKEQLDADENILSAIKTCAIGGK